jgi:hypothetical protein
VFAQLDTPGASTEKPYDQFVGELCEAGAPKQWVQGERREGPRKLWSTLEYQRQPKRDQLEAGEKMNSVEPIKNAGEGNAANVSEGKNCEPLVWEASWDHAVHSQ